MSKIVFDLSVLTRCNIPLHRVAASSPVYREGEEGTSMYIVCSGAVEITNGTTQHLLGSGEIFGELALIEEATRKESATACGATELAIIDKATFRRLIATEPELALQIMQVMAVRLRGHA